MAENNSINETLALAMREMAEANYDKSVDLLNSILSHEAGHKLALSTRGAAYLKSGRFEAAVDDFTRVIDGHPEYARAWHLRGLAREHQGDDIGALQDFDRAVELDPGYGAAYFSRANLHAKMGSEDLAGEDFKNIAHLTNHNIETFANHNNVWRSQHLRLEQEMETELER